MEYQSITTSKTTLHNPYPKLALAGTLFNICSNYNLNEDVGKDFQKNPPLH